MKNSENFKIRRLRSQDLENSHIVFKSACVISCSVLEDTLPHDGMASSKIEVTQDLETNSIYTKVQLKSLYTSTSTNKILLLVIYTENM